MAVRDPAMVLPTPNGPPMDHGSGKADKGGGPDAGR